MEESKSVVPAASIEKRNSGKNALWLKSENPFHCSAEWHLQNLSSTFAPTLYSWARKLSIKTGVFSASAERVAKYFGIERKTVLRALEELACLGFFELTRIECFKPNVYRIVGHKEWAKSSGSVCRKIRLPLGRGGRHPWTESRGDPYDTSMENLRKAFASKRYHPPRPFRSKEEQLMVRRLALWWWTCRDPSKPSARAWAKQLGVTHVWLLKLVRKFETDPGEVRRLQAYGDPTSEQLDRAKESTQRMRDRGELRSPHRRVPPAIEPAMEQFVRERFAQGWNKARLARELFLDRKMVKRILQKV